MARIGDFLKDILYLIVYGLPYEEYKEYRSMIDGKKEYEHTEKAKTFGEELHEIATPIHEENERKNKEEKEKLRKEREANHNRAAKVVFDIMKDTFVKRANNGCFYYNIVDEDIKNMLKDKGFDGLDIGDLVKALSKTGKTMGIRVDLETYQTRDTNEDGEIEEGYRTWVTFEW